MESCDFFIKFYVIWYKLQNKINSKSLGGAEQEILSEAERLEVKDKAALVLVELLMDEKVVGQIKQHRKLLLRVSVQHCGYILCCGLRFSLGFK